jgi:zinc protease
MKRLTFSAAAALLLAAPAALASQAYPTTPPPPGLVRPLEVPAFRQETLANGMQLVLIERHDAPVVSVSLALPGGASADPAGKEGLAQLTAQLLSKGAGTRTAEQIAAASEEAGGTVAAGADADYLSVQADFLSADAALAFELVADMAARPTLPAEELEIVRASTLSFLQVQQSQPSFLAQKHLAARLYGEHPYARMLSAESIRGITRDDVAAFAAARLRPRGALLIVAGDVTWARARELAERAFGGWTGAPAPLPAIAAPAPRTGGPQILLVYRPGSVQSNILAGNLAAGPADRARAAATIAVRVLGGGASGRLFTILREQKGWTYGSYASVSRPLGTGTFQANAEVRTEVTDSAVAELLAQLRRLREERIGEEELARAKDALVGGFPLGIVTARQVAAQVLTGRMLGLPDEELRTRRTALAAVDPAAAQTAARAYVRPDEAVIVVVGDASRVYEGLARIAPVQVVDMDGRAMTADDLAPKQAGARMDAAALVPFSDSSAVLLGGNPAGWSRTSLERTADGFRFTEETEIGGAFRQRTEVLLAADGTPRTVTQRGSAQGQETRADLAYAGGRVTGTAVTPGAEGLKTTAVDAAVPAEVLDENLLSAALRTLPLAAGSQHTLAVFSAGANAVQTRTFRVTGTEQVTVPAGSFAVFRVESAGGPAPVTYYVTAAAQRRLVKLDAFGGQLQMVLAR